MPKTLAAGATLSDAPASGRVALPTTEPHVYAWVTTLVALVGYIVLLCLHITPPAVFDTLLGGSLVGAAGLSFPRSPT